VDQLFPSRPLECHDAISLQPPELVESAGLKQILDLIDLPPTPLEAALPKVYRDTKILEKIKALDDSDKKTALLAYARQVIPKNQEKRQLSFVMIDYSLATVAAILMVQGNTGYHPWDHAAVLATVMTATYFVADAITGVIHKLLDRGSEKSMLGGAVTAFRYHHEYSNGMSKNTYVENTADTAKFLMPAFGVLAAIPVIGGHIDPVVGSSSLLLLLALMNSQTFHAQAHMDNPNIFFKFLQKTRLALRKQQHMAHHQGTHDRDFAALSGWSNPVTRNLWPYLDLILWRANRKFPSNWSQHPASIPPEVVAEIKKGLVEIPPELLIYTQRYEKHLPKDPELRSIILQARENWRLEFIKEREANYLAARQISPGPADLDWAEEKADNPWIFGK
jgi:hypothetical protein